MRALLLCLLVITPVSAADGELAPEQHITDHLSLIAGWPAPANQRPVVDIAELQDRAERGEAAAQFLIGLHFATGDQVSEDTAEAIRWWRRAAEQGYARAQYTLGWYFDRGIGGLAVDKTQAAKWYRLGAEQGERSSQIALSNLYAWGDGVERSWVEAHAWRSVAIALGSAFSGNAEWMRELEGLMNEEQLAEARELARERLARIRP